MSSTKQRPEKIMITSMGSRGDCQPYIALGKGLVAAGYEVLCATNINNEKLVTECGLNFAGVFLDCEKFVRENAPMAEAMAQGNTAKFSAGFAEGMQDNAVMHAKEWQKALTDFKPDVAIFGTLTEGWCASALCYHEVPVIFCQPSYTPPRPKRMVFGLPNLPFGLNTFVIQKIFLAGMWQGVIKADAVAAEVSGHKISEMVTMDFMLVDEVDEPNIFPRLVTEHPKWCEVMYPGMKPSVRCVGTMALTSEFEEEVANKNGEALTSFGKPAELEKVKEFLAAGSKPIFMGWGSMTCRTPEHMMELVASAVQRTGYRAIIQAGWAKLNMELLKKVAKDKSLVEYAEKHVLFIDSAPHEWLFPQCACVVQHGGAGTTACSLRAGTPPVITPVFMDQFDFAHMVNSLGVGVGFENKQFQKISAKELSDAIVKCVTSPDISAKAAEMGVAMLETDGVKNVVAYVEEFWTKEVVTGRQLRLAKEALQQMKKPRRGSCTCWG